MSTFCDTLDFEYEYWCGNPTYQDPKLDRLLAEINNLIGFLGISKSKTIGPAPSLLVGQPLESTLTLRPELSKESERWDCGTGEVFVFSTCV